MKVQDLKLVILKHTDLSVTKAHQKALRIAAGQITLESVIGNVTSASQQVIYIPRGYFYVLGKEETTITRKVNNIEDHMGTKEGTVQINKRAFDVRQSVDGTWILS